VPCQDFSKQLFRHWQGHPEVGENRVQVMGIEMHHVADALLPEMVHYGRAAGVIAAARRF